MATGEAIWRHPSGGGGRPSVSRTERGDKARSGCRVVLALAGQILPSDLKQAGSAIRAINQVQQREHDRTSLFDQWREMLRTDRFGPLSSATENGFAARKNGFFGTLVDSARPAPTVLERPACGAGNAQSRPLDAR